MRGARRAAALTGLVAVLAACGGEPLIADGEYAATPADVSAQVLTEDVTLTLDDGTIEVGTECTEISGLAEVDEAGDLSTLRLAGVDTRTTCGAPGDDPDGWVEAFLRLGPTVERGEDGGFQLFDEEVVVRFSPA